MLHLKLAQNFEIGVVRKWRLLVPAAESLRLRAFRGASTAVVGAVAGWGAVLVLGAALMTGARHEATPAAPAPALAVALVSAPAAPARVALAPAPIAAATKPAAAAPAPIPAPAPTKVTQRVDMSPTAAIPETPKPHHKPRQKKAKDLDNKN